jgi:alkylation response protein AidB-like acyl-CoA dehydrogenase
MDFTLTESQIALKAKARRFLEEVLEPLEPLVTERGHLPMEHRGPLRQAVRDWGFTGINHAVEDGGKGFTLMDQAVFDEQLGRASCGLWAAVSRPATCLREATPAQKQRYLVPACRGERRAAYAVTEPGAGSDVRMIETRAERHGNGFRISGEKWFVTSYDEADFLIVQANVAGDPDQPTLFLVDRDTPGIVHQRSPRFMHDFIYDHAELVLEGVEVSGDAVLGTVGGGLELTKDWFVEARLQIAAHTIGAATRAAEIALDYARSRRQFGQPIASFQAIEIKLADMAVQLMAAQSMLYRVASGIDAGADRKTVHAQASALKLYCSEAAGRVVDEALQVLGGRGYMRDSPVEHLYRDIRVDRIWEGTSEIQRLIVAGQLRKRGFAPFLGMGGS